MDGPEQREFLCWISRMMGEQETSQSVPDLGRRDIPTSRHQATYESDIGPHEGIDTGKQDATETEGQANSLYPKWFATALLQVNRIWAYSPCGSKISSKRNCACASILREISGRRGQRRFIRTTLGSSRFM